jgi:hypothetical protein
MSTHDPAENDGIIEPGLLTRLRWLAGSRWLLAATPPLRALSTVFGTPSRPAELSWRTRKTVVQSSEIVRGGQVRISTDSARVQLDAYDDSQPVE